MVRKPLNGNKMSYREFVEKAVRGLRKKQYKGIHVVYSGFNKAFETYYDEAPRPIIDQLVAEGFAVVRPAKGGATLFLASEMNEELETPENALAKILATSDKKKQGA